jgi:hypothetical protein
MRWFSPLRLARTLTFICLLALDFKHTFEFVDALSVAKQAQEPVVLFGPLLAHLGITVSNGVFDALAYAAMVTATIFFMSNTLAHRLARGNPSVTYWLSMLVGVALSFLTNAGTLFLAATGLSLIPGALIGLTAGLMGGIVTLGLFMFASMDAWDMKHRVDTARTKKEKRAAELTKEQRRLKYTPKKHLVPTGTGKAAVMTVYPGGKKKAQEKRDALGQRGDGAGGTREAEA